MFTKMTAIVDDLDQELDDLFSSELRRLAIQSILVFLSR